MPIEVTMMTICHPELKLHIEVSMMPFDPMPISVFYHANGYAHISPPAYVIERKAVRKFQASEEAPLPENVVSWIENVVSIIEESVNKAKRIVITHDVLEKLERLEA